jgi:uncharacterized heparinase superfamily protein
MTGSDLALLARMAVHLQPGQVAHRARLRVQRTALRRWPQAGRRLLAGPDPATAAGWPAAFVPVDGRASLPWPDLATLALGRVELLGMTRELGEPPDWQHANAPQLWRFHLHYWDWAWGLASDADLTAARTVFARLWRTWQTAAVFGRGDAWLPYPAALRAWSWCGLHRDLVAGSDLEDCFVRELAVHTGFLRRHLESDIGGNHLIKDLKALAGLAVFFADSQLLHQALRRLIRQLVVQVLPDGGHYERTPAYHCQVLADLIDVADLVQATGSEPPPELTLAIRRMRRWLGAVISPTGAVPMLNDGYPVPAELLGALRPEPPAAGPLLTLPDTGLVRASVGGWHLLADVGAPCPDELPGHAHADTFSCVVHVDGMPLLVDTGTSTYAPGCVRDYERSTAAHSTVEVDGADSTEVWGAFRAGRRARVRGFSASCEADVVTFEAVHDGFRRLPGHPSHHRRWSLTTSGLRIDDLVTGEGRHTVTVRWHLVPGSAVRLEPGGAAVTVGGGTFRVSITASCPLAVRVELRLVAEGFLRTAVAPVLAYRIEAVLPVRVSTSWRQAIDWSADEEGEIA